MYWENAKDQLLKAIEKPGFGLITDVDGTISPIVDVPDQARVTPRNRNLLAKLNAQLPLVGIITGRSIEDVYRRVGLPGLVYVGNHGMEIWQAGKVIVAPTAAAYRDNLLAAASEIKQILTEGLRFEDKGATLSVHYRQTKVPERIAERLFPSMQKIAERHSLYLTQGRMVFEFRPPVEIDKGSVFEDLIKSHHLDAAFYLGDDTTDVAVFLVARRLRESGQCLAYGLGVESQDTPQAVLTEADFLIQEVAGVESFLDWLSIACIASST